MENVGGNWSFALFWKQDENENIFWDLANFKLYKNIPLNKRWENLVLNIKFVILEFQPKISIKGSQNPENISKPFHLQ